MHVKRVAAPQDFLAAADALLLADEARHNLILGVAGVLRDQPAVHPTFDLWIVDRAGDVAAAGLRTPPFNVLVAGTDEAALGALAGALHAEGVDLPGVTAAVPEADVFARRWAAVAAVEARPRIRQRIYRLRELVPPRSTSGGR